ncbi:MAG TPA: carboxypeptidase regulatory-like domain-containing protein [Vicinamibacterales bacterium]|nr:carboxypeptidase regulatory-like domain-containing protein [Vicinamibacterales bacterium]
MRSIVGGRIGLALALLVLWPMAAIAQSSIAGVVKDASGAVLPGVTVEASSTALIEKTRTAVTDAQGAYKIVDLRPGIYALTFSLGGFNTFKRDGIDLPSSFVATINAEMKVGTISETVVVTGESPVVDVQSNTRAANLTRDILDSVPNAHTLQSVGQLVVGVTLTAPDVGGSQAMQQTYFTVHGAGAGQTSVLMDGMIINGLQGDGAIQSYLNDAGSREMVYQTGGGAADSATGGLKMNLIPNEGGNRFAGSLFTGFERTGWQSDNLSPFLFDHGVRTLDKIGVYHDVDVTQGGPVMKDKLWFFASARFFTVNKPISNTFHVPAGQTYANCVSGAAACEQGIDNQTINSGLGRVTWQASPRNKFSVYADKIWKTRSAAMQPGDDPDTSSVVWTSPLYLTTTAKWTSTVSSKLLVEGGYSSNIERYENLNQPGISQPWGTPAWLAGAPYRDAGFGTTSHAASVTTGGGAYQKSPDRYNLQGSATYVTGSHSVKIGFQDSWGLDANTLAQNADLVENFQAGVPLNVILEATANPKTYWSERLNANLGIYAQDQWTFKRMTISYAGRWEYVNEQVNGQPDQAGRFSTIPAFGDIKMPVWKSFSPRGSIVYDLTGDGKTAVRFGFNRFQQAATTTFASLYDPANALVVFATAPWTDKNKDNIAQGNPGCSFAADPTCEINFAAVPSSFLRSVPSNFASPDPNISRPYSDAYNVGVTREIFRGVSLSFDYFHNNAKNVFERNNILRPGVVNADGTVTNPSYRAVTIFSPIDGHPITMYDTISAAVQQAVTNVDSNDSSLTQKYDGFEVNFTARLPHGGRLFGGSATDRTVANVCSSAATNPSLLNYCDQSQSGIPWRTQFKLAGTYPLPWGVYISGSFQALPGYLLGTQALTQGGNATPNLVSVNGLGSAWTVTPTTTYSVCPGNSASSGCVVGARVVPGMNSASFSVPLVAPGTEQTARLNQLDLAISKRITIGRFRFEPKADLFNALNSADYFTVRSTAFTPTAVAGASALGPGGTPTAYLAPSSILQGRLLRIGANVTW